MSVETGLGIYAAMLSTAVAAIQLVQWWRSYKFINITAFESFYQNESEWEIRVSNRGPHPVTLHYVAYGVYSRPRFKRWTVFAESLVSISELIEDRDDGEKTQGEAIDGRILSPGESVRGLVSREQFDEVAANPSWRKIEFGNRRCVWVEHSQSDRPAHRLIKLSRRDWP